MQAELRQTQEYLQTVHEEYQTTVEELRSANEELLSANEEYHSTLEELETSKEELQSLNEELQTLNQQLRRQFEEASQANSDLQNLFAATQIATVFLDRELRIKRYTPRASALLNLTARRPRPPHRRTCTRISTISTWRPTCRRVLASLIPTGTGSDRARPASGSR